MNFLISVLKNYRIFVHHITKKFNDNFTREIPELYYALNICDNSANSSVKTENPLSVLDNIINNGFLWAVPKARRSLERRMTRRMGFGKMLLPKKNLVICDACGHFHPIHTICGNCYEKVKEESLLMREAILNQLKLDPIDKEVVVLYEDDPRDEKMFEGKRIVEIEAKRPQWFSRNLLTKDSELPRQKPKAIGEAHIQPTVTDDK